MPRATLPTTPVGWLAAIAAATVGFFAGFVALAILNRILGV